METQVFELYKEIIIDGICGAGINPEETKLKCCKNLMSMILEVPVEVINDLEDVYVMSAYDIYLKSYWESDSTRWNKAVCNITNGIAEMKERLMKGE